MTLRKSERGTVIVLAAVLMPVLLFTLGFAVDFGIMYTVRNAAQNAADAAAMAGALAYSKSGDPGDASTATAPANKASLANPIFGGVTVQPTTITAWRCTDSLGISNYCVKAIVNSTSPVFFAKVFGKQDVPIQVTGTAQASAGFGYVMDCQKPIFIPDIVPPTNTPIQNLAPGTIVPNIRPTDPCNGNKSCTQLTPSTYYSLDFSSLLAPPSDPNGVYPVVFADGSVDTNGGTNVYVDSWTQCTNTALHCGQKVRVEPGLFANPTTNSVQTLLKDGNSTFYAPVWDASQQVVNGNNFYAVIVGFAKFSNLSCTNNCRDNGTKDTISATFQQYLGCTTGNVGTNTGSYASPIRLIKNP
jgi:Flp pilus assembly protein TadG